MEISPELAQATFQFIANSRSGDAARLFLAWEETVKAYNHERTDKLWLSRKQSSLEARIEAARDPDLQGDMIYMSTEGIPWNKFREMCDKARGQEGTTKNIAPTEPLEDFAESLQMMKLLRDIQIEIRGGINVIEEDMLFN